EVEDNSNTTMVGDASIDFLNCTKTTTVGKLNLGSKTLTITNVFAQAGSEVHVNTGLLWLLLQNSMLVDITTLFPEYGTVFDDFAGSWGVGGAWNTIGGTGFYNFWQRSLTAGAFIRNSCNHLTRKDF